MFEQCPAAEDMVVNIAPPLLRSFNGKSFEQVCNARLGSYENSSAASSIRRVLRRLTCCEAL